MVRQHRLRTGLSCYLIKYKVIILVCQQVLKHMFGIYFIKNATRCSLPIGSLKPKSLIKLSKFRATMP